MCASTPSLHPVLLCTGKALPRSEVLIRANVLSIGNKGFPFLMFGIVTLFLLRGPLEVTAQAR